jgi:hypothetical protein
VLDSLIHYLRAAVPRLDGGGQHASPTSARWCRPTWRLMHLRMPDRLQYSVSVDPDALPLHCPPRTPC